MYSDDASCEQEEEKRRMNKGGPSSTTTTATVATTATNSRDTAIMLKNDVVEANNRDGLFTTALSTTSTA